MSTEDPKEPVPAIIIRRVAQTPPQPAPLRRTMGFWSIPVDAPLAQAAFELQRTIQRYVEPISDDEAASFGVPPPQITVTAPEAAPAEDRSFTEETFGDEVAVDIPRRREPSGRIAAPRLGARRR